MFLYIRSGQTLTCRTQVPCDSRSLRNRTDSMSSACVRSEQQDFPGEEEERLAVRGWAYVDRRILSTARGTMKLAVSMSLGA
jgi:hypothetical protein